MKYPKLAAAVDDLLAKIVKEQGEDTLNLAVGWFLAQKETPPEKLVAIPVTKELVLSEQTEVRNGD
jgi:hypothetical protein